MLLSDLLGERNKENEKGNQIELREEIGKGKEREKEIMVEKRMILGNARV